MAGKQWLRLFLKRQTSVSVRPPDPTSYAMATASNSQAVSKFFNLLDGLIQKHHFDALTIYNCDETGMKTLQQSLSKILVARGKRQVGSTTSAERGKNVKVICAANACGNYIPPSFIFPRVKMNSLFMDQAPHSSQGFAKFSGWMTMELYKKYMEYCCKFIKPTINKPVLLIPDGHCSHTKRL